MASTLIAPADRLEAVSQPGSETDLCLPRVRARSARIGSRTPPGVLRAHRRAGRGPGDEPRMPRVRPRPPGQEPTLIPTDLAHPPAAVQQEPKLLNTFVQ